MVMRVQVVEGEYRVVLPPDAVADLNLTDGGEVSIVPVLTPRADAGEISADEAEQSYFRTEHLHHKTYTELAK